MSELAGAVLRSPAVALSLAGAVALALVATLVVSGYREAPHRLAARQLEKGDARAALSTVRVARAGHKVEASAWLLEARALHQLDRHDEEWLAFSELPTAALDAVQASDVLQLVEDFGRDEKSRELREQLNRLAQKHFGVLKAAARGDQPDVRWGAARFLDAWGQAAEEVTAAYSAALKERDVQRRETAARRLRELDTTGKRQGP